ncbi:ABC transporter substrate-binding protein [Aeromicrobium duanguangcaii]|uniref:ABC transporter substrate-binding protein n=1 Tax=Aeromicrobium duanguangcaii TaxID=2968086 RepID=A0ABY5KEX9_9ACTN|nr:ABC transporter substrate-binding protein [Aeromicrobium duanguangcaii]MCD9153909.1 ABC transporter substrate-binding protein [Aeromicrobium duanguangcaii]UUI69012.1 ABC transporter substrate-binding protein [Aeromicrobium duanguangcaii]
MKFSKRVGAVRRSTRRRGLATAAVAAVAASLLAACGGGDSSGSGASGETPEQVTMVLRNDVDTFDPMLTAAENGAVQMYEALYDTLVRRNWKTGDYEPAMATSWEITPTKIDFALKDGLKCSDGSDLLPSDVQKSLERLADPKTGSIYTGRFFGAGGVKQIVADDEANTVSVEVNEPHTDLIDSMATAFIVCPKGLADTEALATTPQGSGPYKLTSMKRGDTYELEAWGSPALEDPESVPAQLTYRVVTSDSTRANLVDTGDADIVSVIGRDSKRLEASVEPIQGKAFQADSIVFNQRPGAPFADERLRRVAAQAIDATSYTKAASFDVGEAVDTLATPNMDCYVESNGEIGLKLDKDQAKADLEAAGYGPGGKELSVRLLGYDLQNSGPEYVADALRELGIKVDITNGTLAQAAGVVYGDAGEWDVMVFPMNAPAPHLYPAVTKMSSNLGEGGSYNFGRVRNEEFDRYAKLAPASTGDERCENWSKAEAALLERTDVVPMMWPIANYFSKDLTFETGYRTTDLRTIRVKG